MKLLIKIYYYASICTLLWWVALIVYVFWLLNFDGNPPIRFDSLTVANKKYYAWDYIEIISTGCVYTDAPSRVYYSVVDGMEYIMPELNVVGWKNYKGKCFNGTKSYFPTPEHLPSWPYYLKFNIEYKVNVLKKRIVHLKTDTFYIHK